jgi:hypothetical protein
VIQSKDRLIEVIGLLVCVALLLAGCGNGSIGAAASGSRVQQSSAIGRESKTMTASLAGSRCDERMELSQWLRRACPMRKHVAVLCLSTGTH